MSAGLRKRQRKSSAQFGMISSTRQHAGRQAGLPAGANELGHHCTCASVAQQAGQPLLPICPLHPDACLRALLNLFLLSCASRSEPCKRHAVDRSEVPISDLQPEESCQTRPEAAVRAATSLPKLAQGKCTLAPFYRVCAYNVEFGQTLPARVSSYHIQARVKRRGRQSLRRLRRKRLFAP